MPDTFVVDAVTGKSVIIKDKDAVLDYVFDWTAWLDGVSDTLSTQVCAVEAGSAIINSSVIAGKTVHAWVSGGTLGETCTLRCRITTAGGRTDDRSVFLKIKEH